MVGVVLFFISFAMGLGGVPNVVSGEILPHQTKVFWNTAGLRQKKMRRELFSIACSRSQVPSCSYAVGLECVNIVLCVGTNKATRL